MGSATQVLVEDVSVTDTWSRLKQDASAVLIDVRTRAEWAFVGLPDLETIGKRPVLVEWQTFPDNKIDPNFADKLSAALTAANVGKNTELLFLCRSGGRSKLAAQAMIAAGYTRCRNVADGFEGALDPSRHRGRLGGWKAAGLPWTQG